MRALSPALVASLSLLGGCVPRSAGAPPTVFSTTPVAGDAGSVVRPAAPLPARSVRVVQVDADGRALDGDAPPPPSGAPISIEVDDADLDGVLRLIGDVSGLHFVVPDSVSARVTVRLVDVPWDQALGAILAAEGLRGRALPGGEIVVIEPAR